MEVGLGEGMAGEGCSNNMTFSDAESMQISIVEQARGIEEAGCIQFGGRLPWRRTGGRWRRWQWRRARRRW